MHCWTDAAPQRGPKQWQGRCAARAPHVTVARKVCSTHAPHVPATRGQHKQGINEQERRATMWLGAADTVCAVPDLQPTTKDTGCKHSPLTGGNTLTESMQGLGGFEHGTQWPRLQCNLSTILLTLLCAGVKAEPRQAKEQQGNRGNPDKAVAVSGWACTLNSRQRVRAWHSTAQHDAWQSFGTAAAQPQATPWTLQRGSTGAQERLTRLRQHRSHTSAGLRRRPTPGQQRHPPLWEPQNARP